MSNWIMTYSGGVIDYDDECWNSLSIEEIAASLSKQCRYNGHTKAFYSVAEHSVHVSRMVDNDYKLAALLHDASEAYVSDLPRPLKKAMGTDFSKFEDKAMESVARKFGLEVEDFHSKAVKDADNAMLYYETKELMHYHPIWETFYDKQFNEFEPSILCLNPEEANNLFLNEYELLMSWAGNSV